MNNYRIIFNIYIFMCYFMPVISFCIIRKIRKFSIKKYLVTSLTLLLLLTYLECLQYSEIFYPFFINLIDSHNSTN